MPRQATGEVIPARLFFRGLALAAFGIVAAADGGAVSKAEYPNPLTAGAQDQSSPCMVKTKKGPVAGKLVGQSCAYYGIPYAAPPFGELRFRPPDEHDPWTAVLEATAPRPRCAQLDASGNLAGSEDCLIVNVWGPSSTPHSPSGENDAAEDAQADRLPVMVYFHGGGHVTGSGSQLGPLFFSGQRYIEKHGVITVFVQRRVNVTGFLALPALDAESPNGVSGNYGILDEILALKWIRHNIARFGGDPRRVMLDGFSAGGQDVVLLMVSPLARGLFAAVLAESPGIALDSMPTIKMIEQTTGARVLTATGCDAAGDPAACLRALPIATLVKAFPGFNGVGRNDYVVGIDGYVIPGPPLDLISDHRYHHVPLLIGNNAEEDYLNFPLGSVPSEESYQGKVNKLFGVTAGALVLTQYPATSYGSPERTYVTLLTDNRFVCPTRRLARAVAKAQDGPVYRYLFTHGLQGPSSARHAFHQEQQYFVWHDFGPVAPYSPTTSELALSESIEGYWARFTRGDPNGSNAVAWPAYDPATDPYLTLDDTIVAGTGVRTANCDFWDSQPELNLWGWGTTNEDFDDRGNGDDESGDE